MKFRITASQLAVAAVIAAGLPSALFAQTEPQAAEVETGGIADIVVTAQRREESLQKVPIAVTAITAVGLQNAGATNTLDLSSVTPGLQMNVQRATVTPYLRGVGTENGGVGEEGSIATYIDGVYVTALSGANLSFNNIERVEVLKGPQGTLFGRNATGGLIQIVTKKPSHTTMVDAEASYANYQTITGKVYATTGLTERLAVDFAGFITDQGKGWGKNVNTNAAATTVRGQDVNYRNEWALRGSAFWEPTDTLNFRLAADYNNRNSDIGNTRVIMPGTVGAGGAVFTGGYYDTLSEMPRDVKFHQWGASLVGELEIGSAKLRSTTAYRKVYNYSFFDQDATSLAAVQASLGENTESIQQELILLGDVGRLNYTAGLFYFHSKAEFKPFNIRGSAAFNQFGRMGTDSYAAFAQGVYALTDTTNVTVGLRYTRDERDIAGQRTSLAGAVLLDSKDNPDPTKRPVPFSNNAKFNKITWRGSLDQKVGDNVLLYGTVSRGFKSGIYNLTNPFSPPANPETLDAYEIGIKSDWLNRTLRFNMSAFYYDYKDIQLSRIVGGSTEIYNAAKARVKGFDADVIVAPPVRKGDLQIRAAVTYLHGRYTKFDTATLFVPQFDKNGVRQPLNQRLDGQDVSGNSMRFTPPVTINLGGSYSVPVSDDVKAQFNVNYLFNSGFFWDPGNRRDIKQKAYETLSGRIGLTSEAGWRVALFMNNITNERYLSQVSATSLGDQGSYAAPRTYGVTLGWKFGG